MPAIAKVAFTSEDLVRDVIRNFNADGFGSLCPKYRGARPPTFTVASGGKSRRSPRPGRWTMTWRFPHGVVEAGCPTSWWPMTSVSYVGSHHVNHHTGDDEAVRRIDGWPATLTESDLLDAPVVLRPVRVSDARTLRRVREANASWLGPWDPSDPETSLIRSPIARYVSMVRQSPIWPYVSIIRRRQEARQGVALLWVVCFDGQLVGQLSVMSIVWGSSRSAQVGYWIDERFAGRRITPTVLSMAVDYCFHAVGLHRIEARVRPGNASSRRVVEKLGFRDEGIRVREARIDGAWRDHISYAITAEDVPNGMLSHWRSSLATLRSDA